MSRRLTRHIDSDLVERILSSGPIKKPPAQKKTRKQPRPWWSYRGAWARLRRENHAFNLEQRRAAA